MMASDPLRTALREARGLGWAGSGAAHWWAQRLTAVALVPLAIWLVVSLLTLAGGTHGEFVSWLRNPLSTTLALLFLVTLFYHVALGLQVVLEDYIHNNALKVVAVVATQFACIVCAVLGILAVLRVAFTG